MDVVVPFGAESGVAQQALGLLANDFVTSRLLAQSSCFGWVRVGRGIGGEALAQIAQTDYALFRHAEATSEKCSGARIADVACIGAMLSAEWWRKREGGIAGKPLKYLTRVRDVLSHSRAGQADGERAATETTATTTSRMLGLARIADPALATSCHFSMTGLHMPYLNAPGGIQSGVCRAS